MYLISERVKLRQRLPLPMQVRMLYSIDLYLNRQDPEQMSKTFARHNVPVPVPTMHNEGRY
jgi:hypothetical protein